MKRLDAIKIDLLPDGAKREIVDFYEYLLHKYSTNTEIERVAAMKKKHGKKSALKSFFKKIDDYSFELPQNYHFSRDSLYDR